MYLTSIYDTTSRGAAMLAIAGSSRSALADVFNDSAALSLTDLNPDAEALRIADIVRRRYRQWSESFARLTATGAAGQGNVADG